MGCVLEDLFRILTKQECISCGGRMVPKGITSFADSIHIELECSDCGRKFYLTLTKTAEYCFKLKKEWSL